MYTSILTCVPQRHKECHAEHSVDDEEAAHLHLSPPVPPLVLLHREVANIPVPEGGWDVNVRDDVDHLLETAPISAPELF